MNSTEFPINSSEEEGQERDIGESLNDDEGKPCVFLSSLLQGGLLDFANWLVTSPGVAPASGETASHFLSAARVETSLNAVQDGLLNLLPYDYCGGRKALQERQFQLLQHMPEGTTPVFGARVDCYNHTDIKSSDNTLVDSGTEEYKGENGLGSHEEEKYSRSLVILAGNMFAPLSLSTMLQRTREFTSLLETIAAIQDTQDVLSQYSSFHSELDVINQRVASGAQVHSAQLLLHDNLREIECTLDGTGPIALQTAIRQFFSTIHAAVSDEIEQHAARGSNSSAVDGGEGSAKVNLNSCTLMTALWLYTLVKAWLVVKCDGGKPPLLIV